MFSRLSLALGRHRRKEFLKLTHLPRNQIIRSISSFPRTVRNQREAPALDKGEHEPRKQYYTNKYSGQDVLPSAATDPDTFGTLTILGNPNTNISANERISELRAMKEENESIFAEEEENDSSFLPDRPNRWSSEKLRRIVKMHVDEKRLKTALDVFFGALEEGGFKYDLKIFNFIYTVLISECGRVGYVQMAFKLYHDMRARCGLQIEPHAFTGLLNSIANAPLDYPNAKRLEKIQSVRSIMSYKGILPNTIHYNALIKAYGRAGEIAAAFSVVDEMLIASKERRKEVFVGSGTFAFLLQACISNPKNGFRHAILTWQKMKDMKRQPTIFIYNLFLRVIRDCGIEKLEGYDHEEHMKSQKPSSSNDSNAPDKKFERFEENLQHLEGYCKELENQLSSNTPMVIQQQQQFNLPDLSLPENRFLALGGLRSFIRQMKLDKIEPDLKTLTQLTEIVHPGQLEDVIMLLDSSKLRPDIDFFNLVMKRLILWKDTDYSEKATQILELLPKYQLSPNIMTWGILALKCKTWHEASWLLTEMDMINVVPNYQIMGAFQTNALKAYDPKYMIRVMETVLRREIQVNQQFLDSLLKFRDILQNGVLTLECNKLVRPRKLYFMIQSEEFKEYWPKFKLRYRPWLSQMESLKEQNINPLKEDYDERIAKIKEKKRKIIDSETD